jgi:hypothetical protein
VLLLVLVLDREEGNFVIGQPILMGVEKDEWLSNFRVAIAALPPSVTTNGLFASSDRGFQSQVTKQDSMNHQG